MAPFKVSFHLVFYENLWEKSTCWAFDAFLLFSPSSFHWFLIALSLDFQHKKYICSFLGNLSSDLSQVSFQNVCQQSYSKQRMQNFPIFFQILKKNVGSFSNFVLICMPSLPALCPIQRLQWSGLAYAGSALPLMPLLVTLARPSPPLVQRR